MNRGTKIVAILLMVGLISTQIYYFINTYPEHLETIENLNDDIATKEQELINLENGLKRLPETKQKLANSKLEVVALIERMPSYSAAAKDLSDMMKLLENNNFTNIQMDTGETIEHVYEGEAFIERKYTLVYTSPFSDSKAFVENLNNAYQVINVSQFVTDNAPQADQDSRAAYELIYGQKFKELVETTLTFSLFVNPTIVGGEVYDPAVNMLIDTENAFRNIEAIWQETGNRTEEELRDRQLEIPRREGESRFYLDIKGLEVEGENYSFSGPSKGGEGLSIDFGSTREMYIVLNLRENGYQLSMKDKSGKGIQDEMVVPIKAPLFQITSELFSEQMGNSEVHIMIENETSEVIVVDIEGTMRGNLHIYNEHQEEVERGGIKGKLIVR